jgi:hypothetical protein
MEVHETITTALKYFDQNGIEVPVDLRLRAKNLTAVKADVSSINAAYHDAITQALITYFEGGNVTGPRNAFRVACSEAFYDAFYSGWSSVEDGTPSKDALDWLTARINQEYGHIDGLFVNIKDLRKEEDFDYFSFITARADGYTATVSAIYNAGAMWAKKGKMGTWVLGNTETHCDTCRSLNGGKHRLSWYVSRNYIPRQPGAAMQCGGYNCDCRIIDDEGNEITI